MKSFGATLARRGALAAVVLLFAGWALLLRPPTLEGPATFVIVRGSSMQPTYKTLDLIIVHSQSTYSVGDIAAYRVPKGEIGAGSVVIHRIVGGDPVHGFTFKGDNNSAPDPWHPKQGDLVGRSWGYLPGLGKVVVFIHQPLLIAALAAAIVVSLILARPPKRTLARWGPTRQRTSS